MLIRFIVKNFLSFGTEKEFNTLPYSRLKGRLEHHKYSLTPQLDILKLATLYGANGAGKSNLVKALRTLQQIVQTGKLPIDIDSKKFLLSEANKEISSMLAVEFCSNGVLYVYAIEINHGFIQTEELYHSNPESKYPEIIFERKTNSKNQTTTRFHHKFEADKESQVLQKVIEKTLAKPNMPLFTLLANLENEYLKEVKNAFDWFNTTLNIIPPKTNPINLVYLLQNSATHQNFAEQLIRSFNTGIQHLKVETQPLQKVLGEGNKNTLTELNHQLKEKELNHLLLKETGEDFVVSKENGQLQSKKLFFEHEAHQPNSTPFNINQESDGTIRLLEFIPILKSLMDEKKVFVIDEIERSLHPVLIKEIIRKFSTTKESKGQLIFTSHESHLLDQAIFRPDEIWFVEKDHWGYSDLYPLSEFKEHKTKDIRKGYLNGRYGAIPIINNLEKLKWTQYAAD